MDRTLDANIPLVATDSISYVRPAYLTKPPTSTPSTAAPDSERATYTELAAMGIEIMKHKKATEFVWKELEELRSANEVLRGELKKLRR